MLMESQAIPVAILTGIFVKKRALADQIHDLRKVAELRGWEVIEVVKRHGGNEDMDGDLDGAAGLRRVLELARSGRIQKALVDEVAGVAGSNRLVCAFLEELVGFRDQPLLACTGNGDLDAGWQSLPGRIRAFLLSWRR